MWRKVCVLLVQLSVWAVRLSMKGLAPQASLGDAPELVSPLLSLLVPFVKFPGTFQKQMWTKRQIQLNPPVWQHLPSF